MTRPSFRFPLAETLAVVGIAFGAWLIHNTFRPFADTPNYALLAVGALDILLCFAWLGYLLRGRLRAAQPLPKSWIVIGVLLIAGFLGWITALFVDSDRAVAEQQLHQEYLAQIAKLETSVRHFSDVITPAPDRGAW
jgi:4-amino-4-deoxy-L-arabinose transferase-like glycosyltransferase